jgi:hypothetical protein
MGSACIDPHFLDVDTSWRWVVSFTPPSLSLRGRKNPRYPLDKSLSAPQSRSGRRGEENILNPIGTRAPNPRSPTRSQSLYRLNYLCPSSYICRFLMFLFQVQSLFNVLSHRVIILNEKYVRILKQAVVEYFLAQLRKKKRFARRHNNI